METAEKRLPPLEWSQRSPGREWCATDIDNTKFIVASVLTNDGIEWTYARYGFDGQLHLGTITFASADKARDFIDQRMTLQAVAPDLHADFAAGRIIQTARPQ